MRGRGRTGWVVIALAVSVATSMSVLAQDEPTVPTPIPPTALRFEPSGLKGGGFFTSVAFAPGDSDTIVLAGGNSGYQRSTDLGASFTARNRDLLTLPNMRIASVAYHSTRSGVLYGVSGTDGRNGGVARSLDDGLTWQILSNEPRFSGQDNTGIADLPDHPRSTGALIATDEDTVWVGTFDQGVMRSDDAGLTWEVVGLPGAYIRTLVRHPNDPDMLFVGTWGEGLFRADDARASLVTFEPVVGSPRTVEEAAFVGDTLYVAAGTDGLHRLDGATWSALTAGVPAGSNWTAVNGLEVGGKHLLFAGCAYCVPDAQGRRATLIRSRDGGRDWQDVTNGHLDLSVVGTGERWLMADGVPAYMPGAVDAIVSEIALKEVGSPGNVVVLWAGRGGLWRSTDEGDTWAPAVNGLSEANSEGSVIDPSDPGRVFQGAAHFGMQVSTDAFASVHVDAFLELPPLAGQVHPTAIRTAFDTTTDPATVVVAAVDTDVASIGEVFATSDPFDRDAWLDLGFSEEVPGKQPTSLAVGQEPTGERVIVAAVQPRGGLIRKVGEGPWQKVEATDAFTGKAPRKSDMLWVAGTGLVYAYDLGQGIYRSQDHGLTFELVWHHPTDERGTGGAIAVSPSDPSVLYVAAHDGLYRLEGADSATEEVELDVTQLDRRAISDVTVTTGGAMWAIAGPTPRAPTTVLLIPAPSAEVPVTIEYSDDVLANTMVDPETLVVTGNGVVLVGGLRSGTLRGIPAW